MLRTAFAIGALATLATLATLAACSTPSPTSNQSAPSQSAPSDITIFAAASLTEAFNDISESFASENTQYSIASISYDGSATLATQINAGAPVDVFASADQPNMDKVVGAGNNDGDPQVFARNLLTIVVAKDNPRGITSLADLANAEVSTVLCAAEVPCGAVSKSVLEANNLSVDPVSEEQNVKAVLTKVSTGEADAGLVYVTDVNSATDEVEGIAIAGAEDFSNDYYIATVAGAQNTDGGQAFIDYLLSEQGQEVLASYGFQAP